MKVSELIEKLSAFRKDLDVYLASDPEGNEFHSTYLVDFEPELEDRCGNEVENVVVIWP